MEAELPNLIINSTRTSGTKATIKAQLGDKVLALDSIDLAKASDRARFAKRLCDECEGIDKANVDAQLLRIGAELAEAPAEKSEPDVPEVDGMIIVRPELFNTPDVSGITVASRRIVGGKPAGQWELYLRWANGKREKHTLTSSIALPSGRSLWLHPIPGDPGPTIAPGWTAKARRAWLDGAAVPDPVDVFTRLCKRIAYFVELPSESGKGTGALIAIWIMFTYVYPVWAAVPYLSLGGTKESGKSTLLNILGRLIFRPLRSSSMTAACLFRTLHDKGGTLLLDEAEALCGYTPKARELLNMLLAGQKRGSPATRLEKVGDTFQRRDFDVFGPKALAAIAQPPSALASRCIRLTMFRAGPGSPKPRRRIDAEPGLWADLRDDLHTLALEHGATWQKLAAWNEVCPTMSGRDFELWQPLLALAAWLQENGAQRLLRMMQDYAAQAIALSHDDTTPPADEILLRLLATAVQNDGGSEFTPGKLLQLAQECDAEQFKNWTARRVSAALKQYRIRTNKPHNGKKVYGRITIADLRQIEAAYSLDLGLPNPGQRAARAACAAGTPLRA